MSVGEKYKVFFKKKYMFTLILACFLLAISKNVFAQDEYNDEVYDQVLQNMIDEQSGHPYDYKLWERNGKYQQKINEVGFRLLNANRFPHRVHFVLNEATKSKQIVNANARSFDRTVTVYKGILDYIDDDEELAAVLAHELGHMKQYSTGNWLWRRITMFVTPKRYEYDADLKGIDYMVKAGYNPLSMISFLNKICEEKSGFHKFILYLEELNYLFLLPIDTHPTGSKRLLHIYNYIRTNYPTYIAKGYNNEYYINFLINNEKINDVQKIKDKYKLTVPDYNKNL